MTFVQFNDACDAVMVLTGCDNDTAITVVEKFCDLMNITPAENGLEEVFANVFLALAR